MQRDRANEKWRRERPTQTVFLGGVPRFIDENDVSFCLFMLVSKLFLLYLM